MKREEFTKKLVRMIEIIQLGALPARVRELYVFGSYSRGALAPGDLDVVVVYDDPGELYWQALENQVDSIFHVARRFESEMRGALRKPGEKVQIILTRQLDHILGASSKIKREDLILLWSEADQDYRPRLEGIRANPAAGRASRDHIIELKRLHDTLSAMESTVEKVRKKELVFTRIPIDSIDCQLNAFHARWLEWWTHCKVMGKDSMKLLPFAMWWLQQHRQRSEVPDSQCVVWSKSHTHRVHLGRPSLAWMIDMFRRSSKVKRQCLIPYIRCGQPNELLVFERDKNWSVDDSA